MEIYWRNILKRDLCEYLSITNNDIKKEELERLAKEKIDSSELEKKRFFTFFEKETALSPYFLEKALECTKAERLKWTKEGRLKVVNYVEVQKYGKKISCPMYSFYQVVFKINKKTLEEWRNKKQVKNKIISIEKAKKTKEINNKKREIISNKIKDEFKKWYMKDFLLAHVFRLSYWTVWLSYLIEKFDNGRKKDKKKILRDLYERKNKSMILLNKTPYSELSIIKYDYYDLYNNIYKHNILMYFLDIKSNLIPNVKFSFFAPYSIELLRNNFPKKENLPRVEEFDEVEDFAYVDFVFEDANVFTKAFILNKFEESYSSLEFVMQK